MTASASMGFVLGAGAASLVATALFARSVLARCDEGAASTSSMDAIAGAIREGAHAFLRRQYRTVAFIATLVLVLLFVVYDDRKGPEAAWKTAIAFVTGAVCSAGAGFWGMFVSLRANVRVAGAARAGVSRALDLALRGGAAAGLPVIAASLIGVSALFLAFGGASAPREVPYEIVGFAFGASFVALFAQLGGGIYTKAADIGADLVGKVEAGIPEDDPRNPAVIADLVGDNVGDCAGRGADIFESAAAENIGAMILGIALFPVFGIDGVVFPLVVAAFGLLAAVPALLVARMKDEGEDPMRALTRGQIVASVLACAGLYVAVRVLLGGSGWLFCAGVIGLATSFVLAAATRYYTGVRHRPVRTIAASSIAGPTANVVSGLALALESTAVPVLTISAALLGAYVCGVNGLPGVAGAGIYGTAVATTGMLSTVAYILSLDMFGPITDNAGGIVEMSEERDDAEARARTDRLDAVGNVTKATTKGYAIGSAALAAFLLFSAYLHEVSVLAHERVGVVDLGKLPVFLAALLGASVVFVFSGLAIRAVVRDAQAVIEEVRRQLRDDPGILARTSRPDYARCVDIVTAGALEGMIVPGLLGAAAPVAVGLFFGATARGDRFLAAEAVAAALMAATIAGVLLASFMNTGGAAWDNAKKLIETGELGGKGGSAHKASVVGDGVGDPLKDTAGPSIHVLIKLLGTVALVTAPLYVHP
ncbi:MAG: sodium-translocating pyrophosphatase [Labilithrix sp.]|nr:sodium-translocating pyrophosphatase [Labilithrix sp.]